MKNQAKVIQAYLLKNIQQSPRDIVKVTMGHFGVARTTVLRHLNALIKKGQVIKTGQRKQIIYSLTKATEQQFVFNLKQAFAEHSIWSNYIEPKLAQFCNKNALAICEYTCTELLNNAHDHSLGTKVTISLSIDATYIHLSIQDNGIGIFQKIEQAFGFSDVRDSILELSKGKLTTDPANHTGEGIFFSSRATDVFEIHANNLIYFCDNENDDWTFQKIKTTSGSKIYEKIKRHTSVNLVKIFKKYQNNNTLEFAKTDIHLSLADEFGTRLISRSQAKRIVRSLEKFSTVTLDFKDIEAVGQGFVDEIFRVYQSKHPDLKIIYVNASGDVEYMIKRGVAKL